jgi:anhydro-N-acetylmuramic acid kinase
MVIDGLTGSYDRDGALARRGRVDQALLERLVADPYYAMAPPKTAGREQYGVEFLKNFEGMGLEDAVATATELTVQTIARAVAGFEGIGEVIVSGGGAHNGFLMERLRAVLSVEVKTSGDYGIDVDAKEAVAFAILAYESFHGRPGNVPSATGARRAVVLGTISAAAATEPRP